MPLNAPELVAGTRIPAAARLSDMRTLHGHVTEIVWVAQITTGRPLLSMATWSWDGSSVLLFHIVCCAPQAPPSTPVTPKIACTLALGEVCQTTAPLPALSRAVWMSLSAVFDEY